jgi:nucleoid DNA-binding protein
MKELVKMIKINLATHHKVHEISYTLIDKILDAASMCILHSLQHKKEVNWSGVGAFVIQTRKATMRRNPQNGAEIKIPSKEVVKMKLFKSFVTKCANKPTRGKK